MGEFIIALLQIVLVNCKNKVTAIFLLLADFFKKHSNHNPLSYSHLQFIPVHTHLPLINQPVMDQQVLLIKNTGEGNTMHGPANSSKFLIMKKITRQPGLFAIMLMMVNLFFVTASIGQTVFTDNYNRATLSPGGTPSMTYTTAVSGGDGGSATSGSSFLRMTNDNSGAGNANGLVYTRGSLSTFSAPFNATLTSNTSTITWTFNMKYNRTTAPSGFDAGNYGIATVLAASGTNFTTANGYAVVYGGTETTKRYKLVSFSGGLDANANITDIITSTSAAPTNVTDYVSIRVTYDPVTDDWAMYFRNDGASAWASPASGVTTQMGSTTSNTTFVSTAMSQFGFLWAYSTTANQTVQFDNFNVEVCQDANAGADQTLCNTSTFTLAGNAATSGSGAWTVVSGPGTVTTPTSATSTITGVTAGSTTTLRWTITNATCITTDDVVLTNNATPTTANAGADRTDITTCGLTTIALAANAASAGTGAWSIVSGAGGSFADAASPTSNFTGTAGTTYTLRWTISNAPCTASTDDVVVTFNRNPTAANAGADQTGAATCGLTSVTLAGNTPTVGTGAWTILSGTGGNVTTPGSPTSTFTGVAGNTYTLTWTTSNAPCNSSSDNMVVTFNVPPSVVANAGPDQTSAATCGLTSVTLAANDPSPHTGAWSVVSGTGGSFGTASSPTSTFNGTAGNTYTLRWTITNAPCTSTDDVVVTFNRNPSTANAGADLTNCNVATFTMNATNPTVGTGAWSLIAGTAGITTPGSRTSGITGVTAGTSATLRWTVSNAPCTASTDDIVLTNVPASTVPNAGANQTHCNDASFTLAGNTITQGTGSWSLVSGTATIITPSSPTSAVAGIPAGTSATLRWTNTNAPCAVLTDDVVLINNDQPITTSVEICQGGTGSLTSSFVCPLGTSTTSGPNNATTGANVNGPGTGGSWTNTGNLNAAGSATVTVSTSGTSEYLQGTGYGFAIPAGSTINGIQVAINRSSSSNGGGNSLNDADLNLLKAGTIVGTDKATATDWPTSLGVANYGGAADLWGTTWTASDINAADFGVSLSALNQSSFGTRIASVDYIQVTVTYTPPGSINWYTVSSGGTLVHSGNSFNPVNDLSPAEKVAAGAPYTDLTNTNTPNIYTFWAECSTVPGCRTQTDFIINEVPTITLGTNPSVSRSTTTANITYSAVSGSPDEYSIDFDAAAEAQGFVDVVNAALPASPIAITVPATANAATYNATLTVRNSIIPICPSAGDAITVTVDPVALSITGITADDKPYDGNNTATLSGTAAYVGLVNGETPAVTGTPAATFNNKNVGTAKPVTVTGYTAPNANYTLPAQPTGLTADINSIALTALLTGTVSKPYDGNTAATLSSANYNLAGVIGLDDVSVSNTSGSYDNKNTAGSPTKTVTVTGLLLSGADAGNYTISNAASVSGNVGTITALGITVTPDAGQFKVFGDANPTYTYALAPALISPDVITGALSRVAGETIGTYAYTLGSLSAGSNYSLSLGGSNTFEIQAISQSNADFRSKANGNFSAAGTWEYDLGGGTWTNASQAPTSANDVSVLHDVALDQNYTVGASKNFSISGSGTFTVNPNRVFTVAGTANFGGKLVTFKSDNSGTSSLGQVTGTLNGATNVTVERYVPNNGFRSWRLLSVPTFGSGQTIRQAWQEGVANPLPLQNNLANFGTQITGPGLNQASSQSAGFDDAGNTAALLTWNGTGWSSVTGTNTPIAADKAYFLYIRGERSKGVSGTISNSSATTLRTNGTVYTGDQVTNIGANAFALVPNVYPSAINFTGLTRTGGVSNLFYIWDSKKQNGNSLGMYQTFSGTNGFSCLISGGSYVLGDPNVAIESGQAFFVQSNATPGTITLKESSKNGGGSSLGFRPATPAGALVKIDTKLYNGNSNMLDANVVVFDAAYSNAVDGDDAPKLPNPGENVAVQRGSSVLVIEGRQPAVNNDVIQFKMWNMTQQAYKFEFIAANMSNLGLTAVLEDAYLNTSTPLDLAGTSTINFTVDANAASASGNRFRIVFKQLTPVPVSFISISGNRTNAGIKVDWKVAAERSIRNYEVERSTDGRNFSTVGAVTATGNSSTDLTYSLTDASAPATAVFYRIKSNGLAGDIKYSSIVKVGAGNIKPGYAVSPNPVENGIMNLQFKNQPAGKYSVTILTNNGQRIMQVSITHADGSSSQEVALPETMARGTYQVEIIAPDHTRTVQTLFVNKK